MPDMNGLDVAKVIRNDELLQDTIIIMLTSVDNISESHEFRQLNINAHLTKPARASQLLESIVDTLRPIGRWKTMLSESADNSESEIADSTLPPALPVMTENSQTNQDTNDADPSLRKDVQKIITTAEKTLESGLCILVAEDNEVNQMVFTQILEYLDYEFKIVENGQLAVEEVIASRPEIILMDVSMPVMNGLDATREIRQKFGDSNPQDSYRPIIIGVTAHALKDDRQMCFDAGMDDYMSKPISPDMLTEKIKNWLSGDETTLKTG
jgi:CheY-like chemotaxis protein